MNKLVDIRNESGFGLIHVLAVTLIVSIAVLGLFMSIEYARMQARVNYHNRSAMLIAQGYLEEIKYDNRGTGIYSRPTVETGTETKPLEINDEKVLTATVTVSSSTGGNAYSVSGLVNAYRDEIMVEVSWKEYPSASMSSIQNRKHSVMLKEDYYWKRSGVSVQ